MTDPSVSNQAKSLNIFNDTSDQAHPIQAIYNLLSSLTDIETVCHRPMDSLPLTQVLNLMPRVQLQHLGIPSSAVGRLRHGISMKVAEKLDMFDIAAFVLPKGFTLHLHDHPNMTVCSKLLLGEVHIRSFSRTKRSRDNSDPPTPSSSDARNKQDSMHLADNEHKGSDSSSENIECTLTVNMVKTAEDAPWFLTPEDGNYHEITPLTDCVLLDILLPPYDDHDRNCNFYEAEQILPESWLLKPLPLEVILQQRERFPLPVQYKGYRPRSR